MYKLVSFFVVLSLAAACNEQGQEVASTEGPAPMVSSEADIQAVTAVRNQEVAAFTSGDATLPHVSNDVVIMPPGELGVVGSEAAQRWAADFMSRFAINSLDYTDTDIIVAEDWAIERYAGSVTLTPTDGEQVTETIKGIHIYERQADGSWKITQDVWNFDPTPTAE